MAKNTKQLTVTGLTYLKAFKWAEKGATVYRPDGDGVIGWGLVADGENATLCDAREKDGTPARLFHEDIIATDWVANIIVDDFFDIKDCAMTGEDDTTLVESAEPNDQQLIVDCLKRLDEAQTQIDCADPAVVAALGTVLSREKTRLRSIITLEIVDVLLRTVIQQQ
jgi:hypothetical protein